MVNGGDGFDAESFEKGGQIVGRLFHPANGGIPSPRQTMAGD
jgi:hypothetical protein